MTVPICLTTGLTILFGLVGIIGVLHTDFSGLASKLLDFKFKEVSIQSLRLAPMALAMVGMIMITNKEIKVGDAKVVSVVSCDKTAIAKSVCSLCSLRTLASK